MLSLQHFMFTLYISGQYNENIEENKDQGEFLASAVLPDAIRAYTGNRQYSHFEQSFNGKDISYLIYPKELDLCTKKKLDECSKYLVKDIRPCVIGEPTHIEKFFELHSLKDMNQNMFKGIYYHLIQDTCFDDFVRDMVDCSRRYEDIFIFKKTGEAWNGKQMRDFIGTSEQYGIYLIAKYLYEKFRIIANNEWVQSYIGKVLRTYYPLDLAEKTLSFMHIDDPINEWITNKDFSHFENSPVSEELWDVIYDYATTRINETERVCVNKKPIILAKSAMVLHQMQNKMNLGADALELQLLGEFVTDGTFNPPSLKEALPELDEMLEIPIYSIHCPLCAYADNVKFEVPPNLEIYMQPTHEPTFDRVCELANLYGEKQNKQVRVIVHTEFDSSRMNGADSYFVNQIYEFINKYLEKYPYIDVCIENVTPITFYDNGTMAFRNGCQFETVELVKGFREKYPEKARRVFTSLDTSHFEITRWIMNSLNSYDYIIKATNYQAENYYAKNSNVCGEIHLSRTVGSGVGEDKQGQPFADTYSDLAAAKSQIRLYKKYGYTCPICLEVTETNYDVSDGFRVSLKVVRQAIKEVFDNE